MSDGPVLSLADLTTEEARDAWPQVRGGILPIGSNEQHGPNLGMSTDATIASALAERVARRFHPRLVLLPTIPYGVSYHHMAFTGTLTLSPGTLDAVVCDVAESLARHGPKTLVILNGHGGNRAPLGGTMAKLRDRGFRVAMLAWFDLAADVARSIAKSAPYNHACEVETSLAMAVAPDLVRKDKLAPGKVKPWAYRHVDPEGPGRADVPVPFHEMTENGALGDARRATVEDGRRLLDAFMERAAAFLDDFLA